MQDVDFESSNTTTPYPNIPPILESKNADYMSTGVTSSVAIAGHPIHPVLVIFPVAFLAAAAGTDIGYWLTGDSFWARASVWLIGSGAVSGILAAIVGIADFRNIGKTRARTAGWAHMAINVVVLLLTLINFALRRGDAQDAIVPVGLIISLVVATLLSIGGWYGGELSFRHKIGVIGSESRY